MLNATSLVLNKQVENNIINVKFGFGGTLGEIIANNIVMSTLIN
jgi:hypothetical protein